MATSKTLKRRALKQRISKNLAECNSQILSDAHVRVLASIASSKVYRFPKRVPTQPTPCSTSRRGIVLTVSASPSRFPFNNSKLAKPMSKLAKHGSGIPYV